MMRTLLTGVAAAAFALVATAAARAETVYVADMDTVVAPGPGPGPGYVYATDPDYVVEDRPYVQDRSYVVVAPPRERVVVVPRREVVVDPPAYVAPRDRFTYRNTVRSGGYYTTGYSTGGCMIDSRGFERCY